jgi:hypothetical protein
LVHPNNVVKRVGYFAGHPRPLVREAHREIAALEGGEGSKELLLIKAIAVYARAIVCGFQPR